MSRSIVIVDDVAEIRQLLKLCLDPSDFDVVGEAGDGAEAIDVIARLQPEAIVLDLSMPVMDGIQAIPEILRVSPHTKILVLSAFNAPVMAQRVIALGAHAYMEKGTNLDGVAPLLRDLCTA